MLLGRASVIKVKQFFHAGKNAGEKNFSDLANYLTSANPRRIREADQPNILAVIFSC
jgi:hypothetical protein